jgi:hypothetical protein
MNYDTNVGFHHSVHTVRVINCDKDPRKVKSFKMGEMRDIISYHLGSISKQEAPDCRFI